MGRARNKLQLVVGQGNFEALLGGRRGRASNDLLWALAPTAAARADLERLTNPSNESEALALLSDRRRLISERPLLAELAERISTRCAEAQQQLQVSTARRTFISLGVRSKYADTLVRPAGNRGKLHIWPQGAALGPHKADWHGVSLEPTLCGKPFRDIDEKGAGSGRYAFERNLHGSWQTASAKQRCPQCAAGAAEFEETGFTPARTPPGASDYPPLPNPYMDFALAETRARLRKKLRSGSASQPPALAAAAAGAYRKALCAAAGAYCHSQGERAYQTTGPSNSWNNLRRNLAHELKLSETEVSARALAALSVRDWQQLMTTAVIVDKDTGGVGFRGDRTVLWVALAQLLRARLGATL